MKLVKEVIRNFTPELYTKVVTDNKRFWKVIKPMFTDKVKQTQNIILINKQEIISESGVIAEKLNNIFVNSVPNLNTSNLITKL